MKTIGDILVGAYHNYIAPSKKKAGKKEARVLKPDEYSEQLKLPGYDELTPVRRREIAMESPLLMKGFKKKSLDTFRAWHNLETLPGRGKPVQADLVAIRNFVDRNQFIVKCIEARIASHIWGNGLILISFAGEKKGTALSSKPTGEPVAANLLNAEYLKDRTPEGNFVYQKGIEPEVTIHKDRIIHFKGNILPGFSLGFSTIDLLRWTLFSKKNIDIAAGHILSWFSHGLLDLKMENMTKEEKKALEAKAEEHPGAWIHDQDMEVKVANPTAIDPKPFYDYVVLNIAAALNMPTHVLTGIQTGRVTGSEIGFSDYYRDVKDDQEIITPEIEKVYKMIIQSRQRTWKYQIMWNTIYVDEEGEAKILQVRVDAAEKAYNGGKGGVGFISQEEARTILNKGQILVDPTKRITPPKPPAPPKPPEPIEPKKPLTPKPKVIEKTEDNQRLINNWKKFKKKELDEIEKDLFDDEDNSNRN